MEEKPANPEKEARNQMSPSDRINEVAEMMEKRHGTQIPEHRRKFFEGQVERMDEVVWLLSR